MVSPTDRPPLNRDAWKLHGASVSNLSHRRPRLAGATWRHPRNGRLPASLALPIQRTVRSLGNLLRRVSDGPWRRSGRRTQDEDRHSQGAPRGRAACRRRRRTRSSATRRLGLEPVVEAGAGAGAAIPTRRSPTPVPTMGDAAAAWAADIVLKVQRPTDEEMGRLRQGQVLIGALDPYNSKEQVAGLRRGRVSAPSPWSCCRARRRAQAMDVLSSQANLAGYKAVVDAMAEYSRVHADDDDGGRHGDAGQGLHRRRRRRRPAGDRHRAADGRGGHRHRRAAGGARGDREPGGQVRGLRAGGRRDQGRLCPAADAGGAGRAGEDGGRAPQGPGHRRHHGADPGPARRRGSSRPRWSGR